MPTDGSRVLLDTNVAIALIREEADALNWISGFDQSYVSTVAVGELYFGVFKSKLQETNMKAVQILEAKCTVLTVTLETSRLYGEIKQQLRTKGRPIPDNDIWIAATARQHNLPLGSRDGHFDYIEGIRRVLWK